MKCYVGNLDGMRTGMVIAKNQKDAASVAGTSLYGFRSFWNSRTPVPDGFTPMTLYTKDNSLYAAEWIKGLCEIKRR